MARNPTFPDFFDEVRKISLHSLGRCGYLEPSVRKTGSIYWTCGDQEAGRISLTADMPGKFVQFDYRVDERVVNYRVGLESLPSNLGRGRVWYLIRHATGKRCRKLYGIGGQFLSRFDYPDCMYSEQTVTKRYRGLVAALEVLRIKDEKTDFVTNRPEAFLQRPTDPTLSAHP